MQERSFSERRRRARPCSNLDRFAHTQALYHDDAEPSEAEERLSEALRHAIATALTDKQREVVEAHFFEGLSQGEVAARLGISQQVVHKHIHGTDRGGKTVGGALRKLREALSPLFAASVNV